MRSDVEGNGGLAEVFLEDRINRAGRKPFAKLGNKERAFEDFGGAAINLHRFHREGTDGDEAFFGAFSHDADAFVDGVDVFDVERSQFGEAKAGRVEEFEDGGVALAHPRGSLAFELGLHGKGEEFFDLGQGENDGKGLVGFREFDFGDGAFGVTTSMNEEFVKGTVGGEAEANGAAGEFGFLELEEIGSKVVGSEIPPLREAVAEPLAEESKGEGVVFERLRRRVFLGGHELDKAINLGVC